jgi:periplasmic nitrate reductase NapD
MSISGLVVHTRPGALRQARDAIAGLDGVEVHAETADGRLVVTIDRADDGDAVETFNQFQTIDGVLSTSLVYSRFEIESDQEEQVK